MSEMNFRVGDRVWSFSTRKWGKVIDTDSCHSATAMEFEVEFEDGSTSWHGFDDLFFEEIVIPESARTRPTPKHVFKPGDPVCVKGVRGVWYCRVFKSIGPDGEFLCVSNADPCDGGAPWPECRPYDRTLLGFDAVEEKNNE
ncbi:MAG: hypothetical protein IPK58_22195 [Acidobacteria bacterium]|nr:hypothetical protein [Acidobacteriota bacterium]